MTGALQARGLVLDALGERPRLEELTIMPPGPGEARVRMRAAGLCHTDVTQVRDARFTPIRRHEEQTLHDGSRLTI